MKRIINAKFNSTCAETGCRIKKGERMLYDYDNKKCYAIGTTTASNFINNTESEAETNSTRDYVAAQESAMYDRFESGGMDRHYGW